MSADFGTPLIDEAATSSRTSLPAVAAEITSQVGNSLIIPVPSQFLARSVFEPNRFTSPFDLQPGDTKPVRAQDYKDVRTAAALPGERLSPVMPVMPVVPVTASDVIKPISVNNVAVVRSDETSLTKSYVPSETVQTASAQRSIVDPALIQRATDPALMPSLRTDQTVFAPVQASTDFRQVDSRLLETATFKNPAAVPQIAVSELPRSILAKPQDLPTLDAPISADRVASYATRSDLIAAFNRDPSPQLLTRPEPQPAITSYKQDFRQDFNPGFVPSRIETSQDGVKAAKLALIEQPSLDFDSTKFTSTGLVSGSKNYDDLMRLRVDVPPNSTTIGSAKVEPNRDFTMIGTEARISRVPDSSLQVSGVDSRTVAERFPQPSTLDARTITEARTNQQFALDAKPLAAQSTLSPNTLAAAGFDSKVQGSVSATLTQAPANTLSEIRQPAPIPVATYIVRGFDQPTNITTTLSKPPVSDAAIVATPRTVLTIAEKSLPQVFTAGTATITAPAPVKVALAPANLASNVVAPLRTDRASATPVPLPPTLSGRLASLIGERPAAPVTPLAPGERLQTIDSLTTRASLPIALTSQLNTLPTDRIAASLPGANGNKVAAFTVDPTLLADRARVTQANTSSNFAALVAERGLNVTERGLNVTSAIPAVSSKAALLVADRATTAMLTGVERSQLNAAHATLQVSANGISINVADRALIRTTGSIAGERSAVTFATNNERGIKGIEVGHGTAHGANQMAAGDRSAAAAAASIAGRPMGRELGLGADIRNGALPEKGPIQFGMAGDKVVPLGGKLVAFKPLHEISEQDKRYLLGIELAIGAVALAAVARARATEGREGAEENEEKDGDEQVASNSDDYDTNVIQRPKHLVQPGETLQTIAEEYYADANLAWLLLALNKGKLSESWNGDVCYVEVAGRQELELPVREDISAFYRSTSHKFKGKRLVTTVRQSTMDQELVTLAFRNVVGHPTRQLQSASS